MRMEGARRLWCRYDRVTVRKYDSRRSSWSCRLAQGCGRGYDVVALALHGYDAYGLEISSTAVSAAEGYASSVLDTGVSKIGGQAKNQIVGLVVKSVRNLELYSSGELSQRVGSLGRSGMTDAEKAAKMGYFSTENEAEISAYHDSRGQVSFVKGDFFDESEMWSGKTPRQFDVVYDYTVRTSPSPQCGLKRLTVDPEFFCALPPEQRRRWAVRMSDLLRPGGLLVCLEFPLYKDPTLDGPPWGVGGGVYWDCLVKGGTGILEEPIPQETQDQHCANGDGSFVRALFVKPERSYSAGKGTDMLSVWRRK